MKFSQQELKKYYHEPIMIHEKLDLKSDLMARNKDLLDVSEMEVDGLLTPSKKDTIAHLRIKGTLTLPSTRSLKPVLFPIDFPIDEVYMTKEQAEASEVNLEEIILLETNTLNLVEVVEDYLLLSIPTQVYTPEELAGEKMPEGDFWTVISEEDYESSKKAEESKIDPRLEKLKDLFPHSDSE